MERERAGEQERAAWKCVGRAGRGIPDPLSSSLFLSFLSRKDRWDKMRSKVTRSLPDAPTAPPTRLLLSVPLCISVAGPSRKNFTSLSLSTQP